MAGQVGFVVDLGDAYPDRIDELSPGDALRASKRPGSASPSTGPPSIEAYRRQLNEAMADLFEAADFVMASSNPDVAFAAEGPPPSTIPGRGPDPARSGSRGPS